MLILDHFFDDAIGPFLGMVDTTLTLAPCSENFFQQRTGQPQTSVQLLIFNEFEQRWSRSTSVSCYKSVSLTRLGSLIDGDLDSQSVMRVSVAGTLTGQTRIRAVDGNDSARGDGLLAVAQEFHHSIGIISSRSVAFNVQFTGTRTRPGYISLSPIECGPNPGQEPYT